MAITVELSRRSVARGFAFFSAKNVTRVNGRLQRIVHQSCQNYIDVAKTKPSVDGRNESYENHILYDLWNGGAKPPRQRSASADCSTFKFHVGNIRQS
jgi:hypothetical protein